MPRDGKSLLGSIMTGQTSRLCAETILGSTSQIASLVVSKPCPNPGLRWGYQIKKMSLDSPAQQGALKISPCSDRLCFHSSPLSHLLLD